jgi:hypothetical protein
MSKRPGHVYSSSEPILMQTFEANSRQYQFYDEEAARVSQRIDEELKVCYLLVPVARLGHKDLQRDWARRKDIQRRQVKGT